MTLRDGFALDAPTPNARPVNASAANASSVNAFATGASSPWRFRPPPGRPLARRAAAL